MLAQVGPPYSNTGGIHGKVIDLSSRGCFLPFKPQSDLVSRCSDNFKVIRMADAVTVEQDRGPSFAPYFGLYHGLFKLDYANADAGTKRMIAVACALELVKSQVASSTVSSLAAHMDRLSDYADAIESALEVDE